VDDFIINVRQISNYPQTPIGAYDLLLLQQGGAGGPYACCTQDQLLGEVFQRVNVGILPAPDNKGIASSYLITPLGQRQGFNWYVDSDGVQRYLQNGAAGYWSFDGATLTWATLAAGEKDDVINTANWTPTFTIGGSGGGSLTVSELTITGTPSAPTDAATVGYVTAHTVASFNTRTGAVSLTLADVTGAGGAPLASPAFTGAPTAPTMAATSNTTAVATTAFVQSAIAAAILAEVLVSSFNGRAGAVTLTAADVTGVGGALLASPALTGTPTAPTAAPGTSTTQLATTAFVAASFATTASLTGYAPLASPGFTGVPLAPTAAPGTSTTQLATTAFVAAAVVASTTGVATFNTRTGAVTLSGADITAAGGALLASPALTGNPTAPTAAPGDNDTSIATTAFVTAAITAAGGVTSFNTRTGAISLVLTDVTNVGGAPIASPALTGTPTAPTATLGTSTTQLATTAFVAAALATGVTSFNSRSGVVILSGPDITGAGGALLASPALTGTPTAPTATAGTSTTQLATTAFVQGYTPASIPSNIVVGVDADFSASITLAASDSGKIKNCTSASAVTVTLPNSLPKDFYCTIHQAGAGQISFVAGSGAALHNRQGFTHSAGQYALCALIVSANAGGTAAQFTLGGDCA
jgi:hypothetical protein